MTNEGIIWLSRADKILDKALEFAKEYDFTIAVSQMGKVKTSFQGLAIFILLLNFPDYRVWGMISLWISIILSYWSAWEYFKAFWARTKDYF